MKKKISIILFLFVSIVSLLTYFYTINDYSQTPSYLIIDDSIFNGRLIFLGKHEWIVQYNVAQYSSILVEQLDGSVDIEALFFHDNSTKIKYIRRNIKCLAIASGNDSASSIIIDPFEVFAIDSGASIWIIKCKIKISEIKHFQPSIAIIDKNNFGLNPNENF